MFQIIYYQKVDKFCPVKEFIESTNPKMRAKILRTFDFIEKNSEYLNEQFSKHLYEGIFELRVKQGSNHVRILYFFFYEKKIILTNAFIKKTQKTPRKHILIALKYKSEFLKRYQHVNF